MTVTEIHSRNATSEGCLAGSVRSACDSHSCSPDHEFQPTEINRKKEGKRKGDLNALDLLGSWKLG